ncbi:MAG: peptidoglycan-binding protein [Parcubacteria group bacterium]|nr:peptidoglycan-binding protein [Parcubacteria group bacterium]
MVTSTGGGGGGGSGGGGGGGGGSTGGGGSVTVSSATIERLATNILSAQKALLDLAIIKKTSPNDPSIPGKLAEIQKAILEITQELQQILSSASTSGLFSFSINLSLGSYNNDVHELQRILAREKFYFGSITGYFGPVTRAAVIRFQRYFGILPGNQITPGLGLVGPLTRMKLNELLQKP